jgi:beta-N-acetylhexosaminidase
LKKRRVGLVLGVVLVAAAVVVLMASADKHKSQAPHATSSSSSHTTPASETHTSTSGAPSKTAVARLSPSQLLGQRIIYSYAGTTPPASLVAIIRRGEAAGVIFFGENVSDPAALNRAIGAIRAANAKSPVRAPLLLMTDQEGGLVRRLPGAPVLSEKQVGESSDPEAAATAAGTGAGDELGGVGMNVNLAPVLDVFREPGNFIDGAQRSYSSDPAEVARLGTRFIGAQQRTGVAATAKHFPGLGAATAEQNTDAVPVTLDVPTATLRAVDELPFRAAIASGVKLVMVSWARYPALDPRRPAGLSRGVIVGELRGRLGYRGVVITDELAAGALSGFGTIGQRAVLAAGAGADLLLCSEQDPGDNTPAEGTAALNALVAALGGGEISRASAEQAAARVLSLRMSLG